MDAAISFDKAIKKDPNYRGNYQNKVKSLLLHHTSRDKINSFDLLKFKEINSSNIKEMNTWVTDAHHPYFYSTLEKKYKRGCFKKT